MIQTLSDRTLSKMTKGAVSFAVWIAVACQLSVIGAPLFAQSEPAPLVEETSAIREIVLDGAILKTIESTSVSAQVAGILSTLNAKEGTKVKEGTEVGRVRDSVVRLQTEKSMVSYEIANKKQSNEIDKLLALKNRAVADNEYQRAVAANKAMKNVYAVNELERLKLLFDRTVLEADRADYQQGMATLEVSLAEIEHRQNIVLLQRHRILAPCDGVVVAVDKRVGEWLEPGTVLLKIVRTDKLRIEGFLQAVDAAPELLGATATVYLDGTTPTIETTAEVVFISPDANPLNTQVRVFLEIDNSKGLLRPGLRPRTVIKHLP